jgi:hypothetical protein
MKSWVGFAFHRPLGDAAARAVKANFSACQRDAQLSPANTGLSEKKENALPAFQGVKPGICRNSFYGKHLYEVVREAEIPPQLSATQGFRVIFAN